MQCNECGSKVSEGAFCEECGALLDDSPKDNIESVTNINNNTSISNNFNTDSHISLEYDSGRSYFSHQSISFRYAITAKENEIEDLKVCISDSGEIKSKNLQSINWLPISGARREFKNLNVNFSDAGMIGLIFYISYRINDKSYAFESDIEVKVYPNIKEFAKNIEINIQNSGHAADINLEGMKLDNSNYELESDLVDKLSNIPPIWSDLKIFPSSVLSDHSINSAQKLLNLDDKKIILKVDDNEIIVFFKKEITLGKHKECDFVTRVYENNIATPELNSKISRYHCTIIKENNDIFRIIDGGKNKNNDFSTSVHGTFFDNRKIDSNNGAKIESIRHELLIGGLRKNEKSVFCANIKTCYFSHNNTFLNKIEKAILINNSKINKSVLLTSLSISLKALNSLYPDVNLFYSEESLMLEYNNNITNIQNKNNFEFDGTKVMIEEV